MVYIHASGKKLMLCQLAKVTNKPQNLKNYWLVSLLSITSKIFERLLYNEIVGFFLGERLISVNQSGFKPPHSCINWLLSITLNIYKSFDDGNEVRGAFLDISKAFDKVWHDGLIFKLQENGISGNLLKVLKHFLSNRKQNIVLNWQSSSWADVKTGLLQGYILEPLIFLVYINDLAMFYPLIISFLLMIPLFFLLFMTQ